MRLQHHRGRCCLLHHLPLFTLILPILAVLGGARGEPLHRMYQVPGSNRAVQEFFRKTGIRYRSDTVYVFIPPLAGSRVEGGINFFANYLRKAGVKGDIIVLAVHNKRRAAEAYLKRRNFNCDYHLVTDARFLKSFTFSARTLAVPYVTKFCVRTGELLSSYSLLDTVDSATVARFIADNSRPKSPAQRRAPRRVKTDRYRPVVVRRVRLFDTDEHPLSTCYYTSVNPSGTYLALLMELTSDIYVFDLSTGRLVSVLAPDSTEERMFVNVPEEIFQLLKRNNVLYLYYLNPAFSDDTTLLITASLPEVTLEMKGGEADVEYSNKPVILRKDVRSGKLTGCAPFQSLPEGTTGRFAHTLTCFVPERNLAFVPFDKGWPSGGEMLDDKTPPALNPFTDEFYQKDTYQFAVYTLDGRFVRFWGSLGTRFAQLRLGYIAQSYGGGGLARFYNRRWYVSDQFSGIVYVYDEEGVLLDSLELFRTVPPVVPAIDRAREPLRYLIDTFEQNFPARVVDLLVTDAACYALVLWDEGQPVVYRVDLRTRARKVYGLPEHYAGKAAKYYLLRDTPQGIVATSLLESSEETHYCEFRLP